MVGAAVGGVFAITGLAAFDLATEDADAQTGAITKADLDGANARASAAINGNKSINNSIGRFVAEPNALIGAKSGPIPQKRGVGGGLPSETLADGAVTESKLSGGVQSKLNHSGQPGPQGPAGPQGATGALSVAAGPSDDVDDGLIVGEGGCSVVDRVFNQIPGTLVIPTVQLLASPTFAFWAPATVVDGDGVLSITYCNGGAGSTVLPDSTYTTLLVPPPA